MKPANSNPYGITHTDYATDMTEAGDLRSQLRRAGKGWQETPLNMGTFFAEPARLVTYQSDNLGVPVSVLIIPLVGADSWCEEYYSMVETDHQTAISRDWYSIIRKVRDLQAPDTRRKAYRVSCTVEADDGTVTERYQYTKYFGTHDQEFDRKQAIAEARRLTDDAEDDNGVFVSAWYAQGESPVRSRIIATVTEMLYEDVPDA